MHGASFIGLAAAWPKPGGNYEQIPKKCFFVATLTSESRFCTLSASHFYFGLIPVYLGELRHGASSVGMATAWPKPGSN